MYFLDGTTSGSSTVLEEGRGDSSRASRCSKAQIDLSLSESDLLERITRFLELGRYPVGISAYLDLSLLFKGQDLKTIVALSERIQRELNLVAPECPNEDLRRLGVRPRRISQREHLLRRALLQERPPSNWSPPKRR
jgi:hypothetical protein